MQVTLSPLDGTTKYASNLSSFCMPLHVYLLRYTHTLTNTLPHAQDVCRDSNIRVSLTKVLKPDQLVVVIFLTNQKQSEQSGVTLTIEPPSNMKVSVRQFTEVDADLKPSHEIT